MRASDRLSGLMLGGFAALMLLAARMLPEAPGQDYGPGLFPTAVALALLACAALLLLRPAQPAAGASPVARRRVAAAAALFGSLVLLILLLDTVGFAILSIGVLVVFFAIGGVRMGRAVPLAVAVTLVVQWLFGSLLRVPLPGGLLQAWL